MLKTKSKRGVFWVIDDGEILKLIICPYKDNDDIGLSKSGDNYNHQLLWNHVRPKGCNKPYDYYPRGRVEVSNKGKPVVYMNRNIEKDMLKQILSRFALTEEPKIHYDGSNHYKCHLDLLRDTKNL